MYIFYLVKYMYVPIVCAFLPSLQLGSHTTPLQLACHFGRDAVVEVLLNHNVPLEQLSGVSPLCSLQGVP